jgi:hypothetical protein
MTIRDTYPQSLFEFFINRLLKYYGMICLTVDSGPKSIEIPTVTAYFNSLLSRQHLTFSRLRYNGSPDRYTLYFYWDFPYIYSYLYSDLYNDLSSTGVFTIL